VAEAQQAAIDGIRAGMTGKEATAIAAGAFERHGQRDHFVHGLGHGVGLEVHEFPHLGRTSEDVLGDGMVFTIEPGLYYKDWGGVRIEDIVVLMDGSARVLSNAARLRF
jgi:Xaa-Pro aminopeptidase